MTNPRDDLMALAPCPFCGGEAKLVSSTSSTVQCQNDQCIIGSPAPFNDFTHRHDAIAAWNTRLAASRPATQVVDREAVADLVFWYRNYKGEERYRHARPISIRFDATEWHHTPQWLMRAIDLEKNEEREFAMKDMRHIMPQDTILSLLRPAEPVEAKWRPIETAPKEDPERPGRDFEIIVGGGEIKDESADLLPWRPFDSWSLACYDSMRGCWRGEQTEQYDCFYLHKPTHWMPKFAGPGQCGSTTPDAVSEPVEAEGVREPVAWIITWSDGETSFTRSAPSASSPKNCKYQPLYTHAPKSPDTSAAILAEREMCAAIADEWANKMARNHGRETANTIAAAIRQLPTERGDK